MHTPKKMLWLCGFTHILHLLIFLKGCSELPRRANAFLPATSKCLRHYNTATKPMACSSPYTSSRIMWSTQTRLDRLHTHKSKGRNNRSPILLHSIMLNSETKDENAVLSPKPTKPKQVEGSAVNPAELVALAIWMGLLSSFILMNNFVGPWPQEITNVSDDIWLLIHSVSGMLFGGGIILSTCIEWLVAESNDIGVMNFWFDKVPSLDVFIVLPALSMAILSGGGLAAIRYDGLGESPFHVRLALMVLVSFAGWWAATDVTTQRPAQHALSEQVVQMQGGDSFESENRDIPKIVQLRKISNVVSCFLVLALYAIMLLKPGL